MIINIFIINQKQGGCMPNNQKNQGGQETTKSKGSQDMEKDKTRSKKTGQQGSGSSQSDANPDLQQETADRGSK